MCFLTFILIFFLLDVHNPRTGLKEGLAAIDWIGTLSILAVTLMLLLGLNFGGTVFAWTSAKVICLIVFGTLMIGVFIFTEKRVAKYPLMPLEIFNGRSNIAVFVAGVSQAIAYIGPEYYLPLYFQSVKQASPLRSGVLILPITVSEAVMAIGSGVIMHSTGRYREIIWTGLLLMTLGTGLYITFDTETSIEQLVGLQLIGGVGCGLLFNAPVIAIQNTVSQANTSTATASYGFVRAIATSVSIVIGGVVFQNGMNSRTASLRSAGLSESLTAALSGDQAAANVYIIGSIQNPVQRRAVLDAFAGSLRNIWILYTCIAFVGLIAGAFIKHGDLSKEHTETKTGLQQMTERGVKPQTPQPLED